MGTDTITTSEHAAMSGFLLPLEEFRLRVEEALADFFDEKLAEVEDEPEGRELVREVRRLVEGGGKRLRPALVYHTYRALGGRSDEAVLPLALATELLHTYLLIHDDIMDHSELRRGQPSAHARFREIHVDRGRAGDAADFGRSVAILLGDLAHTWAVELYASARSTLADSPGRGRALDGAFCGMCEEVIRGQYLELVLPYEPTPTEDQLLRVLRLKSGRYSVERPIELGARLAAAPRPTLEALARYGRAVGEVFQLQDDVLGTFGDAAAVGKPVASDLIEGKYTFLIHRTLELADEGPAAELHAMLGRPGLGEDEADRAREIISASGGLDAVSAMIDDRLTTARSALEALSLQPADHAYFEGLIEYSGRRDR
ncbi:MAG: polyprenyl synthetase family protein [Gemmatimonadota bacterium]|nr:MAG: polyprenyl synthetase family protein [Gemmatimonadota bacterium]